MKLYILLAVASLPALGSPVSYIFNGFASGSAGSASFNDSPFTITVKTDTTNIVNPFPGLPDIFATEPSPTSIDLSGIGSGTFLSGLSVYDNQPIRELGL